MLRVCVSILTQHKEQYLMFRKLTLTPQHQSLQYGTRAVRRGKGRQREGNTWKERKEMTRKERKNGRWRHGIEKGIEGKGGVE